MKKQLLYLFAAFCGIAFCSCSSSRILYTNFQSDAINHPPAANIPGPPSGDMILFDPALAPQLRVENAATAGTKELHFINAPVTISSGHDAWVNFTGIATNLLNTLWFTHTARNVNATGDVLMDVSDGAGHLMARMRIQANGQVGLARNILDIYTDVIGTLGQSEHTIVFTVMPSSLTYNVTIFRTGEPAITALNKPMITRNTLEFANPAHPSISFQHASTSESNHQYIIESVLISKKNPG